MEVIMIGNEKGGCAKTTTTILLTNCLTALGYRVLAVDLDPTGNLSQAAMQKVPDIGLYDVLNGDADLYSSIVHTPYGDFLTTKRDNSDKKTAAPKIVNGYPVFVPTKRKSLTTFFSQLEGKPGWNLYVGAMLKTTGLEQHYDFAFLDSCPSDGPIITNCLMAADAVLMPIEAMTGTVDGMKMLITSAIDAGGKAVLDGLVISRYRLERAIRKSTMQDILQMTSAQGIPVYQTKVRDSSAIETAMAQSKPILDYAGVGNGLSDAMNLALELLAKRGMAPKKPYLGVIRDETGAYGYHNSGEPIYCVDENGAVRVAKLTKRMMEQPDFQEEIGKTVFFHEANAKAHIS